MLEMSPKLQTLDDYSCNQKVKGKIYFHLDISFFLKVQQHATNRLVYNFHIALLHTKKYNFYNWHYQKSEKNLNISFEFGKKLG